MTGKASQQSRRVLGSVSHPPFELFPLFSTRDSSAPGPTRLSYCLCPVLQPHLPVQALSSVTGTLTQPHLATLFHLLQGLGGSFTPGADPAPSLLRALPGALSPQDRVPDPQPGLKRPHMVRSCWPPSLSPHQPLPSHLSPTTAIVLLPPAFPPAVPQTRRVTRPPIVSLGPASSEQQHLCSLSGLLVVRTVGGGGGEKVCVLFFCVFCLPDPLRAGLISDTSFGLQHGFGTNVLNDTGDESIL